MNQEIAKTESPNYAQILEKVVTKGDLADLTPNDRANYYKDICDSLKLNWRTKPFEFLELKDKQSNKTKIVLYARKDCCEQLRKRDGITVRILTQCLDPDSGIYTVHVEAAGSDGRRDEDIGCVPMKGITAEEKANAMMKAVTKAKRRVTLSICGLGFLDETEIDSIPGAKRIETNLESEVM